MDRRELHNIFASMGFKTGTEIGVMEGDNALNMLQAIPGLKLYLVDPWNARMHRRYNGWKRYRRVKQKTAGHDVVFIRKTSLQAAQMIEDQSLDFVYIDGDHSYDMAMLDIILWSSKVRIGGIVSGHDYHPKHGVLHAVDDYVREHKINLALTGKRKNNWHWIK